MNSALRPGYGLGGRFDRALEVNPPSLFPSGSDEYWMEQALLCSMNSVGLSAPNPAVGCVVVKDQKLLASGFTQAFGKEHAERIAFGKLTDLSELRGSTVFVTLEPCSHFGSQPPCVDLFIGKGIRRVVVACVDPDPRVNGEGIAKLKSDGVEVEIGILGPEAMAFHFPFFRNRLAKRPVWIGKWAQTHSGHLAAADGTSKWISNAKSRAYTHWLRQKYDFIVVGARTFLEDRPALTVRDSAPPHHRNPVRGVFDPRGKTLNPQIQREGFRFFVCESALKKGGLLPDPDFIAIPGTPEEPGLFQRFQAVLEALPHVRPLQSVMVEGGAALLNSLLDEDLLDAVHIFRGTKIFEEVIERHRISFSPEQSWNLMAEHYFDADYLQEWVKKL